jgi:hypothetical protein
MRASMLSKTHPKGHSGPSKPIEMSKESVRIILPKYYTFINDTSFGYIYMHSSL